MPVEVCQKTIDFVARDYNRASPAVRAFEAAVGLRDGERALHCLSTLMGETAPLLSPLSPSYGTTDDTHLVRFDWSFGVSCIRDHWWDWQAELRETSAMAIQLLISTGETGLGFTEVATNLLALQPTRNTQSWLEMHVEKLGTTMASLAGISDNVQALPGSAGVAAALRTSAALANFVASGEGKGKNWFIYRFVDPESRCACVEWKINKKVLLEYGSLLHGSLLLAFHGSPRQGHPIRIELRPQLGFYKGGDLCHVTPTRAGEESRVALNVMPQS